jgi:hypothetical protein
MARGETVTVVRPPKRGRFGDPEPGQPQNWDIKGVLVAPGSSTEATPGGGASTVDTDMTIYPPHAIQDTVPGGVKATDQIRVRGDLYVVQGDPEDWGKRQRMVIHLRKVTG